MEMKGIEVETGPLDKAGPSDQMLETKTEVKDDSKEYCKLQTPADDIYSEAVFPTSQPKQPVSVKPAKPTWNRKNVLLPLCIVLGGICLVELIIIYILNGKTAPIPVCSEQPMAKAENVLLQKPPVLTVPCFTKSMNPATKFSETGTASGAPAGPASTPDGTEDVSQAPDSHRCTDNWVFFENSCFYLSKQRQDWSGSRAFCKGEEGDLVVISDERIQNFLTGLANVPYWIGLQKGKEWKWVNNTTPYNSKWPTGTNGLCAILDNRTPRSWESADCAYAIHFICQKVL